MYVSVCVAVTCSTVTVPWTIIEVTEDVTFRVLFEKLQAGVFDIISSEKLCLSRLRTVRVGSSKESLNIVSDTSSVHSVCSSFGSFIKYEVEVCEDTSDSSISKVAKAPNAFSIMMQAQRTLQLGNKGLPHRKVERSKKDKLFNDIIDLLDKFGLKWTDPTVHGASFVQKLCNVLWYLDGHHATLAERGSKIPSTFQKFVGYNVPEASKHRKRSVENLNASELRAGAITLQESLQASWFQKPLFHEFRTMTEELAKSLHDYADFLAAKTKYQKLHHASLQSSSSVSDSMNIVYLSPVPSVSSLLMPIDAFLKEKPTYEPVFVRDFAPLDRRQRYSYLQELKKGLSVPVVLLTHTIGANVGNYHFLWKVPECFNIQAAVSENNRVIQSIQDQLPQYHTRIMRQNFINMYGRLMPKTPPYILRDIYKELTGDQSGSRTSNEKEIDQRIREAVELEDPDIIVDLRHNNAGQTEKYTEFWKVCESYLNECTAVHDRRHGSETFMAKAISIRDLIAQVKQRCPDGTAIPSESWVRFNFCPQNSRQKVAQYYQGRLGAKKVVQKRLLRKCHPDSHYAAALFRYEREFAIKYRDECMFLCIDDKHKIKVGEPGFPVASAERGRQVIVSLTETLVAGDHDFTKFSLIPSVILNVSIPDDIGGSWYTGQVYIALKDAAFQPSSALRHSVEMHSLLIKEIGNKHILLLYSDGGPDHRLTYISVKLSLIALFLNLDLDMLVACRTAPSHSWRNPVERIMSIVNLGLQCIGLMRQKGSDEFEKTIAHCNSLKEIRKSDLKSEVATSLAPPIELLNDIFKRLLLKENNFLLYDSASDSEIQAFWEILLQIEPLLQITDSTKKDIEDKPTLLAYIKHCCKATHYSFQVKKCGKTDCCLCKPVRMQHSTFKGLNFLPDPVPGIDGHYKAFEDVYGSTTTEEHRPSLVEFKKAKAHQKSLEFYTSLQHVTNVGVVIQCEECEMWRLLFCRKKLNAQKKKDLQKFLEDICYTCGDVFEDYEMPKGLEGVCIKKHKCYDTIEKLYYSCPDYEPICIYCASTTLSTPLPADHYPQCINCDSKPNISKRVINKK